MQGIVVLLRFRGIRMLQDGAEAPTPQTLTEGTADTLLIQGSVQSCEAQRSVLTLARQWDF